MKKRFLFIIVFIICMIVFNSNNKIVINKFSYFHFSYSTGYAINSQVIYEIKCDDKCIATIKPDGVDEENSTKVELNDNDINKLISILKKYKVNKWNGFKKFNKHVMDGNSFSLYMKMNNDDYISAIGYMKWPKNYNDVKSELDSFFSKYLEEKNIN